MVKRYVNEDGLIVESLDDDNTHDFVTYTDYEALEQKHAQLGTRHSELVDENMSLEEENKKYKEALLNIKDASKYVGAYDRDNIKHINNIAQSALGQSS